jgi:hypothetical protein
LKEVFDNSDKEKNKFTSEKDALIRELVSLIKSFQYQLNIDELSKLTNSNKIYNEIITKSNVNSKSSIISLNKKQESFKPKK